MKMDFKDKIRIDISLIATVCYNKLCRVNEIN